jgi:DNA-directed RNA polymerase subunit RPC12/RpoP
MKKQRKKKAPLIRTELQGSYPFAECPDCGKPILKTTTDGDACQGCGHIFYTTDGK